jgi:putative long chain acyl-CoA synthase
MADFKRILKRSLASTRNVLELVRVGRLGNPYRAPFEIVEQGRHFRLRRYATCTKKLGPVALLVPPLMVTSEVYDIEAESSAVSYLGSAGIEPYVVDFGAPEQEEGGMRRTLDDHVLAVARAIDFLRKTTGRDVHLLGYSQGGMFAYQCCAFLRSSGVRSVITFGSPVDLHKNLPVLHKNAVGAILRAIEPVVERSIEGIEGLPGVLTSTAFKIVSTKKEIEQRLEFLSKLHDRKALARREARRRFLGGEGFVAWPGPAFREFVEQFIVHNRMLSGGFVLDGRTVTLADIDCPILAFIGAQDDMARPPTIRAIAKAAPHARVSFVTVPAGHFGIVVGQGAMRRTWPTVSEWIFHQEGMGPPPRAILEVPRPSLEDEPEGAGFDPEVDVRLFVDAISDAVKSAGERVGEIAANATDAYDVLRYQEPRLRRLAELGPDSIVNPALSLSEARARDPRGTFFLWRGRAFSYEQADERVTAVTRGLFGVGVRPNQRVAVLMDSRPSFLSMVTALSRLGAVPVLAPPATDPATLSHALVREAVAFVATDPENLARSLEVAQVPVLLLGAGARPEPESRWIDLERIDPATIDIPSTVPLGRSRARDLAMVLLRPTADGGLRRAPVDNHRWALSAYGAAAACTLKPDDTVYSCLPLHHPSGLLLGVGSALAGGARFALGEGFEPTRFLSEARRYGATVAFYAGDMLRPLLFQPPGPGDRSLPLRLVAGSGMRRDLAEKLRVRFQLRSLEFYAATSQPLVLANVRAEKLGALGKPLVGSAGVAVVKVDVETGKLLVDTEGRLVRCGTDEPGVLISELSTDSPSDEGLVRNAFRQGDLYRATGDVVRLDAEGDLWLVDSTAGFVRTAQGMVSLRSVEDAFFVLPEVSGAAAHVEPSSDGVVKVHVVLESPGELAADRVVEVVRALAPRERPDSVRQVAEVPLTEGHRPRRDGLASLPGRALYSSSQTNEPSRR